MPRKLTCDQMEFVRKNAALGGNELSAILGVSRAAIYQYATDKGFSVKKNGRAMTRAEKRMNALKKMQSNWPRNYRHYKKLLVERDGLRCHYCDSYMTYADAQVDHVLAKARGGTDAPTNLVLACARCNNLKGTTCYDCPEFRNAIA